jgi:hypothetical protein
MVFIESVNSLYAALSRLCEANDAFVFRNPGGIPILLRGIKEDDHCNVDVSVTTCEDRPCIEECMKNEVGVSQEDNFFILHEFTIDEDTIKEIQEALNSMWLWTVCPCGQYIIKQANEEMCYMCRMTLASTITAPSQESFCPICHDARSHPRWMMQTPCCKQAMHRLCHMIWKSKADTCAICRAQQN